MSEATDILEAGASVVAEGLDHSTVVEDLLRNIVQLAISIFGKDKTISILQAEYDAADAAAETAEDIKFGPKP